MKLEQLVPSLLLTGSVVVFVATPAKSKEVQTFKVQQEFDTKMLWDEPSTAPLRDRTPIKDIPRLDEVKLPFTSINRLVQSPTPSQPNAPEIVEITSVKINSTDKGLEVILETPEGEELEVENRSEGNSFIAEISGAQLRLATGNTFSQDKPAEGITSITVTNQDVNTIRVTVLGTASLPTVELFDSDEGLIFDIATVASSTPQQQQPQQPQQPEDETKPDEPSAEADELIELVVTGEQDGYSVPEATIGTRTDTPLRDVPQSVQVLPRRLLEDRQVNRIDDAIESVTGVTAAMQTRGAFQQFNFRGFASGTQFILENGLRSTIDSRIPTEIANIEQIEVIKGPASVLFGQGSPGGAINLVTKKPLAEPFYSLDNTFGNFDYYRGAVDLTGPLNENKTVLYRLITAYQNYNSFVDFFETERFFATPILSWAITPNTNLTLQAEFNRINVPNDRGLPALGTVVNNPNGNIPLSRNIADPERSFNKRRLDRWGYTLEHEFNQDWSLRNAFRYIAYSFDQDNFFPTSLEDDNRTLNRGFITAESETNAYSLTTDIVGNFNTGSLNHKLLIGFDWYKEDNFKNEFFFREAAPIDLFNPVYGLPLGPREPDSDFATSQDSFGIFLQDEISITDNLKILLGGRFDFVDQTEEDFLGDTETSQSDQAFSPRVGIVFQPIRPVSLYASYSRSFNPVTGRGRNDNLFEPERGTQYEIGVKADLSERLSATLALYDLTRSNVLTTDLLDPNFSIQTGEQRSRGVELNIAGQVLPGWNIFAGYAYNDARITEDEDFAVDNRLNNAPENAFNLWTTYQIQAGDLRGLGFGLGLFYVGERQGDLANTFTLPSYLRTDASIFYNNDRFRAAINIKNLFDIDYFESAESDLRVFPGASLTVQGTVSFTF